MDVGINMFGFGVVVVVLLLVDFFDVEYDGCE